MTNAFTIVLPHRRNPGNDRALAVALDCLFTNTHHDFHLLIDAAADKELYPRVNALVEQATTELVVYMTSDTFCSVDWDIPFMEAFQPNTFMTGVVVEPGAILPHWENVHKDFGRKPETFRRSEFEAWAASDAAVVPNGIGFPAPFAFPRAGFLEMGGLPTHLAPDHHGFSSGDLALFEAWQAAGKRVIRVRSFFYHLQRFSEVHEQEHPKRELQSP